MPHLDNALLSHDDRSRIVSDEHYRRIISGNGMGSIGTFLIDGFVGGTWKTERARDEVTLAIKPFETLPKEDRDAVAEEGERLLHFIAEPEAAEASGVRFIGTS